MITASLNSGSMLDDTVDRAVLADWLEDQDRVAEAKLCHGTEALVIVAGVVVAAAAAAEKLNQLRAASVPIRHWRGQTPHYWGGFHGGGDQGKAAEVAALAIARHFLPAARRAELREAARESRTVETTFDFSTWAVLLWSSVGRRIATMAWPEIAAWITADDARRLAEYEEYRRACAEGENSCERLLTLI